MKKIVYFLLLLSLPILHAKDGVLDPDFGTNGQVVNTFSGSTNQVIFDLKIQNDSKIIVAGTIVLGGVSNILVARYNQDGTLDTSFNGQGFNSLLVGAISRGLALAIQPDDKILVAGDSDLNHFLIARYNTNGTLDTTFGVNGVVNDALASGTVRSLALQKDGTIFAIGSNSGGDDGAIIVSYNPDGNRNINFGTGGVVTPIVPGSTLAFLDGHIQNDQKLVVTGRITTAGITSVFTARYLDNGSLDTTFGSSASK